MGGVHLRSRKLRACLSCRVFELLSVCAALRSWPECGFPKRDMLTRQGRGCFCFSAGLAVLLTLHLVDHLLEPESEGHVSFSGVAM